METQMAMTFKEYAGKKVRTVYGNINGHGIKIPVWERDLVEAKMMSKLGMASSDEACEALSIIRNEHHQGMTCAELKAMVS
tara:strand:+ start:255 stop:497 length:243 start_codon:yes stop_codon:yes gene_type:complete